MKATALRLMQPPPTPYLLTTSPQGIGLVMAARVETEESADRVRGQYTLGEEKHFAASQGSTRQP